MDKFVLKSKYKPMGDQPQAIEELVKGLENGARYQTLLGVTGSGKTFTMANIIEKCNGEISYQKSFVLGGASFTVTIPMKSED